MNESLLPLLDYHSSPPPPLPPTPTALENLHAPIGLGSSHGNLGQNGHSSSDNNNDNDDDSIRHILVMHQQSHHSAGVYVAIIFAGYVLGMVILLLHHVQQKHGQISLYDIYLELLPSSWTAAAAATNLSNTHASSSPSSSTAPSPSFRPSAATATSMPGSSGRTRAIVVREDLDEEEATAANGELSSSGHTVATVVLNNNNDSIGSSKPGSPQRLQLLLGGRRKQNKYRRQQQQQPVPTLSLQTELADSAALVRLARSPSEDSSKPLLMESQPAEETTASKSASKSMLSVVRVFVECEQERMEKGTLKNRHGLIETTL